MYLIHLRLRSADRRTALPPQAGDWLWAAAEASDRVEHVAVHALAHPDPVLAMYVLADNLAEAEARAGAVCRRALATRPELTGWELLRGEAPLVMPFFEGLLAAPDSGLDGTVHGRFRPPEPPSIGAELREE